MSNKLTIENPSSQFTEQDIKEMEKLHNQQEDDSFFSAENVKQLSKDFIFDPEDPVDVALTAAAMSPIAAGAAPFKVGYKFQKGVRSLFKIGEKWFKKNTKGEIKEEANPFTGKQPKVKPPAPKAKQKNVFGNRKARKERAKQNREAQEQLARQEVDRTATTELLAEEELAAAEAEGVAAGAAKNGLGKRIGDTGKAFSGNLAKNFGKLALLSSLFGGGDKTPVVANADKPEQSQAPVGNLSPVRSSIESNNDVGDGYFNPAIAHEKRDGEEGACCARDILEKIYESVKNIDETTRSISRDTGRMVERFTSDDISGDLDRANRLSRIYEGGSSDSYAPSQLISEYTDEEKSGKFNLANGIAALPAAAGFLGLLGGESEAAPTQQQGEEKSTWSKVKDWFTSPMSVFTPKGKLNQKDDMMVKVYNSFLKAGFSENQAKALTAEVGRENSFNAKTIFGNHKDAANGKSNMGFFSWQGDRKKALYAELSEKGLIDKNGGMVQGQDSLNTMAEFSKQELLSGKYNVGSFMENENIDPEVAAKLLGQGYIKWAYGQDTLKSGAHFDWRSHDERRRGHLNNLNKIVSKGSVFSVMRDDPDLTPIDKSMQGVKDMPPIPAPGVERPNPNTTQAPIIIAAPAAPQAAKSDTGNKSPHYQPLQIPNVRNFDDPIQLQTTMDNMWMW